MLTFPVMARRPNDYLQERLLIPFSNASETTSVGPTKLWTPARTFRIERVYYNNPTGLAADPTNFFEVRILNNAVEAAVHSTETGQEGALVADTPVDLALSATDVNLVVAAGDSIDLDLVLGGTQTLPAGDGFVEGRYVE